MITNLVSAVPFVGSTLVQWIWGGFRLSNASLARFYMLHFCTPIIMGALVVVHIFFLHNRGRQNPTNIYRKYNILPFHPFFTIKDISFFMVFFLCFEVIVFLNQYALGDPENFIIANMLSTPQHIVPE